MSRAGGAPALLAVLALLAAACSGGGADQPTDPAAADADAGAAPGAQASSPPAGDPTATDPTAGGPAAPATSATPPPQVTAAPVDAADAAVEQVLASLTLEQKVGQLFVVEVLGDDAVAVSDAAAVRNTALYGVRTPAEVVQRYQLGGVAYFDRDGDRTSNTADPAATARLSAGLQQAAAASSGIGLLIGTDQEGGIVTRLGPPATDIPAARSIAAAGDVELARQAGVVTGTEAAALGISWVYAPVADVNIDPANPVIGSRAFGTTAEAATPFVLATAQGLADAGVLPTLKHFPGHGDTSTDSHSSLPTIDHDRAAVAQVDLPPFAAALADAARAGRPVSVMVGHLALPSLDPSGRPATLSAPILDLLRGDPAAGGLGFDGLVVTDAMDMGALQGFGSAGELAVQAIAAGVDVVLMPTDLPQAWSAVLAAAQDGSLPMARIDQAVRRVLEAKLAVGVLDAAAVPAPEGPGALGTPRHQAVAAAIRDACGC